MPLTKTIVLVLLGTAALGFNFGCGAQGVQTFASAPATMNTSGALPTPGTTATLPPTTPTSTPPTSGATSVFSDEVAAVDAERSAMQTQITSLVQALYPRNGNSFSHDDLTFALVRRAEALTLLHEEAAINAVLKLGSTSAPTPVLYQSAGNATQNLRYNMRNVRYWYHFVGTYLDSVTNDRIDRGAPINFAPTSPAIGIGRKADALGNIPAELRGKLAAAQQISSAGSLTDAAYREAEQANTDALNGFASDVDGSDVDVSANALVRSADFLFYYYATRAVAEYEGGHSAELASLELRVKPLLIESRKHEMHIDGHFGADAFDFEDSLRNLFPLAPSEKGTKDR